MTFARFSATALWGGLLFLVILVDGRAEDSAPAPFIFEDLELRDTPLRDALSMIGQPSGLNLAASDTASKTRVSIHLRNVSAIAAVQALCQTHGLFLNRKPSEEGIDIVTTVKEFQEGLTVFREEKTEVYTMLYPNAVDLAVAIKDLFGDRVRISLGKDDYFDDGDDISRRLSRFDLIDGRSQGLATFSSGTGGSSGGSGGGSSGGGGSSSSSSSRSGGGGGSGGGSRGGGGLGGGTRITTGKNELSDLTPEQLDRVAALLQRSSGGVGLEADKLASLGKSNTSAIYVSVLSRNNQIIVRSSDQAVFDEIKRLKAEIDVPTPQVLLEVKVLAVDLTDGFTSVFDTQFAKAGSAGGFSTGDVLKPPAAAAPALTIGGTGAGVGTPFALNPSSMIYQYVNDNFRVRMQLLDSKNRVTTLATPMLLVANNEVSRVFIGQERPIVRNVTAQTTATQGVISTAPTVQIDYRPVGTTLLITPNINADRTVTLRMIQETSSIITGGATIPVVTSSGGVTNQPVDVVSARTLTGTLIAKDGLSLALGGLIEEGVNDSRDEIPGLGKLPVVGMFFRRQNSGRFRRETIIVIRPFILSTPSEAEEVGKKLTDANSIHPLEPATVPEHGEPIGSMNTFLPHEPLRPNPPSTKLQNIFRFHSVLPSDY